jgi:hypothetical protein
MPERLALPSASCSRRRTPTTPKAVLATFVEGGVVDDWGREFVGTDAIRGWSDREFIRKHVSLEIRGIEQNGEAMAVTADVGGEGPTTLASSSTATASHG